MTVEEIGPPELSEFERIAALEATALLDSPAEAAFDQFTRLASTILQTPVALVSLVDQHRQFFKSCTGLPEPWASSRQTPLSHSFCKHVVATAEPLVVADARLHPLLKDNLAIPDLGVIAYLGIPLTTPQGHTLGSFCVIDSKPRQWTEREVEILRGLAALVMTKIQLRLLARRLHTDYLELRNLQLHRDETLHMLVHDMRNPMNSFLGGLELVLAEDGLTGDQKDYLELAQEGGRMLLQMITSILDDSKAEAGRLELNKAEVIPAKIVADACRQMVPLSEKSGVRLTHEASGASPILADAHMLHRVLVNLISNSIQHTPDGGAVTVSAWNEKPNIVQFSVADTGSGIPPEAHEQIFEKYGWAKTKRITGSSTGLGLPFSRMVVKAHGGRIWLESDIGQGTRFYFTIPVPPSLPLK